MSAETQGRVRWPRFDVVVTRWAGEGRARYCVVDHLTKAHRFPLDPYNRDMARVLCDRLVKEAEARKEETTVWRRKEATVASPPRKRERPKLPPEAAAKGGRTA